MGSQHRVGRRLLNLLGLAKRPRPAVGSTPHDVVHQENKWRLLHYRPRPEGIAHPRPLLLVPSLINRHYVLDLMPGKSFVEYLVAQGHDVYIIDWGTPGPEDRYLTFDDICDTYLGRAVRRIARTVPDRKIDVLGYCLGGTLAVIHAAANPEHIHALIALAAPVTFDDTGLIATWMNDDDFDIDALIDAFGNVPWPLMQASFHLLRPTMNLAKLVGVIDRAWDDQFLDGFFAIETWSNDNVSFPGECYRRYVKELYQQNALVRGEFTLHGRPARLESIDCPLLSVTFKHDHIVPLQSAEALVQQVASEDKTQWDLPGGHVGAVVSRKASTGLWPALSSWLTERSPPLGSPSANRSPPLRGGEP